MFSITSQVINSKLSAEGMGTQLFYNMHKTSMDGYERLWRVKRAKCSPLSHTAYQEWSLERISTKTKTCLSGSWVICSERRLGNNEIHECRLGVEKQLYWTWWLNYLMMKNLPLNREAEFHYIMTGREGNSLDKPLYLHLHCGSVLWNGSF